MAIAFGAVLLVELPDKTLVATLILSTKYRRGPVLVGVGAAFAVQCVIAVTAGGLLHLLPHRLLEALVAVMFALGALLLLRESLAEEEEEATAGAGEPSDLSARKIATLAFGVLFAAEWGDASQLVTAGLVAKYGEPVAVGIGAFVAIFGVAVLATVLGAVILDRVPLVWVHRAAGLLFAIFALIAAVAAVRG